MPHPRRAFTLVELLIAMAITGLLLAAIATAMSVAAKAAPDQDSVETRAARDRRIAQDIARELSQAVAISTASTTRIAFTVPDRTGDSVPESIDYSFSGTRGDSLSRTFNGVSAVIADDVDSFQLTYTPGTRTITTTGLSAEGPEQVLSACYKTTGGTDLKLNGVTIAIQKFRPVLPDNAVSWRITGANLYIAREGTVSSTLKIQVYKTDAAGNTSGSALVTQTVAESALPAAYAWHNITFGSMSLLPSQGAAILLANNSLSINLSLGLIGFSLGSTATAGTLYFASDAIAEEGVNLSYTTSGTSSLSNQYDDSLAIEIFGRITTTTTQYLGQTTIDAAAISLSTARSVPASSATMIPSRPAYAGVIELIPDGSPAEITPQLD